MLCTPIMSAILIEPPYLFSGSSRHTYSLMPLYARRSSSSHILFSNDSDEHSYSQTSPGYPLMYTLDHIELYGLYSCFQKGSRNTLFFALFGPIGARFSPPPLRQPHGIKVSHIAKLNHQSSRLSSNQFNILIVVY